MNNISASNRSEIMLTDQNPSYSSGCSHTMDAEVGDSRSMDNMRSQNVNVSDVRNGLLTIAVLIATATYQAMLSPPGGVWQDDKNDHPKHLAGVSIMVTKEPISFGWFMFGNTLGFFSSLSIISYLTRGYPLQMLLHTCMFAIGCTYGSFLVTVAPNQYIGLRYKILAIGLAILLPLILQIFTNRKLVLQKLKTLFHK